MVKWINLAEWPILWPKRFVAWHELDCGPYFLWRGLCDDFRTDRIPTWTTTNLFSMARDGLLPQWAPRCIRNIAPSHHTILTGVFVGVFAAVTNIAEVVIYVTSGRFSHLCW